MLFRSVSFLYLFYVLIPALVGLNSPSVLLRKIALAGYRPHRGRYFAVPVTAAPRQAPNGKTPALLVFNSVFAAQKSAQPVTGPTFWVCRAKARAAFRCAKPPCAVVRFAAMASPPRTAVLPSPSRLRRAGSPTAKPRPSSFSTRFLLRKNRRAHPPAFGRRGVDKVRKYHFVCVVLSSAPLTLSPLYAPARPVFRNRPKEKAAAETRCGCEHAIYEL